MNALHQYGPLAGRIMIAMIFLLSGFSKITGFEGTVGYVASKGVPLPEIAAIGAILLELGGGIMVLLGWKARWGAIALLIFTVFATFTFHNFWAIPPEEAQNQMIHFMKNVSMMGGLLFVLLYGSGAYSTRRA